MAIARVDLSAIVALFLVLVLVGTAWTGTPTLAAECDVPDSGQSTVTGRIVLAGNEPNVRPLLRSPDGRTFSLAGPLMDEFKMLQGMELRVSGFEYDAIAAGLWPVFLAEEYRLVEEGIIQGILFRQDFDRYANSSRDANSGPGPLLLTTGKGNFRLTGYLTESELNALPSGTKLWVRGKTSGTGAAGAVRELSPEAYGVIWYPDEP